MIQKTMSDGVCDLDLAIHWCVSAKNSLQSVYGYSPNQLVFGRNTNVPSVHNDRPPAQTESTVSEYIAENLKALHSAREAFIKQESCERLRRALNRKVRPADRFLNGDSVFYKRNDSNQWHGPATVLGNDAQQYLLKHGGIYIRVHPCRLQHANPVIDDSSSVQSEVVSKHNPPKPGDSDHLLDSDEEDVSPTPPLHQNLTPPPTPPSMPPGAAPPPMPPPPPVSKAPAALRRLADHNISPPRNSCDIRSPTFIHTSPDENVSDPMIRTGPTSGECSVKTITAVKDLPAPKSSIAFRNSDADDWSYAKVVSKAGKATTANWHYMNIRENGEEEAKCISLKGVEWCPVQHTEDEQEDIFFGDGFIPGDGGPRFEHAREEELHKWRDMGAYKEVTDNGQPRISCRWVCTEKVKGGETVLKARLVVRGCEEINDQTKTDSPTCQKESLRLLLGILASNCWSLHSMDIKSAYLQGTPLERELYMKPPKQANTDKLWLLQKCPYGLADAGRKWYLKLVTELKLLGAKQLKTDQAVFVWHDQSGDCQGVMVIHVDDFLYGGTPFFINTVIPRLRSTFKVGLEESNGMKYLGLIIKQTPRGITLSTDPYSHSLKEISDLGVDKSRTLSTNEISALRHVAGQINWIATQSRPDVAYDNCILGNSISKATVREATLANKTVRKAKYQEVTLHFPSAFDIHSSQLVGFSDASFGNLPDGGSQGAYVIFLCDKQGNAVLMAWQSRRIRRAVTSTLAAECLAAVEVSEACILLKHNLLEIWPNLQTNTNVPISIMCDNRSLVDAVHSSTTVQNKRLQIEVAVLREMIQSCTLQEFRWVPTHDQVANVLTKAGTSSEYLLRILRSQLRFDGATGKFM